ncbi:MAG: DUF1493 family protein [Christensenellaceae bacterium]|nr:DUF1493 family protein [Christensenellaceae bacterium]
MLEKVIEIIRTKLDLNDMQITADTNLLSDLSINSLELVELVCEFEVEFDIEVPEKDIRRFSKVSDIVEYLNDRLD